MRQISARIADMPGSHASDMAFVATKYLDQIRTVAKQFSNKLLSRRSGVARCAIINFKKGKNTIKPLTLRKMTKAIHALQNKKS